MSKTFTGAQPLVQAFGSPNCTSIDHSSAFQEAVYKRHCKDALAASRVD